MTPAAGPHTAAIAAELVHVLRGRGQRIAVAESLTGGLLASALVDVPGASAVFTGGIVAYATELKHRLLGVDAELLAQHGPVHPEVARQMATAVRSACATDGAPAQIGLATTGVAGPDRQNGKAPGTAFVGIDWGEGSGVLRLRITGDRDAVRTAVVEEAIAALLDLLTDGQRPDSSGREWV